MPCFIHNRCASKEGCPKSIPRVISEDGHFARPVCSKCEYDKGGCPDCFNFNTEECSIPNRCESCGHFLSLKDSEKGRGYCEIFCSIAEPFFFCGSWIEKETP